MTIKPPLSRLLPKLPRKGLSISGIAHHPTGQMTSSRQIVRTEKDRTEKVLDEATAVESLAHDSPDHTGLTGINLGLTIPGPKNSYMTARIDVFAFVPAVPTDEGMKAALERVSNLAQERLELEVDEAKEALGLK